MRVLAFEDSYDIEALLRAGNIDTNRFTIEQQWDSKEAIGKIKEFKPDILLLDHFMPPTKGLDLLKVIIKAVEDDDLVRPQTIIGISSAGFANQAMVSAGADNAITKFDIATLEIWSEN
mgnify:CR=1 FL=1